MLNREGWDAPNESWCEYYNRTENERKKERLKRVKFVEELVDSYNNAFIDTHSND